MKLKKKLPTDFLPLQKKKKKKKKELGDFTSRHVLQTEE